MAAGEAAWSSFSYSVLVRSISTAAAYYYYYLLPGRRPLLAPLQCTEDGTNGRRDPIQSK
jgi:hypothetical protein